MTLVFIDIDGTLIQENQQPNADNLPDVFIQLKKQDIICGLNTNRSYEDIDDLYRALGLTGPIILENGMYYLSDLSDTVHELAEPIKDLPSITFNEILQFAKSEFPRAHVELTDTTEVIVNKSYLQYEQSLFVNKFRKYTGSVHLYKNGQRDSYSAQQLKEHLQTFFKSLDLEVDVASPPAFGNVVFWPSNANKGTALQKVKDIYHADQTYMIGDDLGDLDVLGIVDGFLAVGNAQPEVKNQANFVATQEYSLGVIECLHHLKRERFFQT